MPGESWAGVMPEEVARHEYGHHVAFNRSNPPWQAVDRGPKRWSSRLNVCAGAAAGELQICGGRKLELRVTLRGRPGPFSLSVAQP